jgi:hypothetical protein
MGPESFRFELQGFSSVDTHAITRTNAAACWRFLKTGGGVDCCQGKEVPMRLIFLGAKRERTGGEATAEQLH